MQSNKIDANLKAMLASAPDEDVPITVVFTRVVPPDELAALGLTGFGVSLRGGTMANGILRAAAITSLAARDDVHRISYRPPSQLLGGP
jgi:hypothetical protein